MSRPAAFRRLRAEDAPDCARLHAQAFASPWPAADFREQIDRVDRVTTAAVFREPALAGFAISRAVAGEADLLTIVVERNARHGGLGGLLLSHHLSALMAKGVGSVFLEVGETNATARALYTRFGFEAVGGRKDYYASAREAAVVMRRDL